MDGVLKGDVTVKMAVSFIAVPSSPLSMDPQSAARRRYLRSLSSSGSQGLVADVSL